MSLPLPRLLDAQLRQRSVLHPVQLSISLNLAPLSTARMTLPHFDPDIRTGDYAELFTGMGSAGVFRIQKVERNHQGLRTVHLEHGLVALSDSMIGSTGEKEGTAADILTQLFSHQTEPVRWQLGQVDVPGDKLLTWSWDYANVLESLLNLMQELPDYALAFDQRTTPWTLHVVACSDQTACECRLNRNLLSLQVSVDRTELCTRLYIPPAEADESGDQPGPLILDADTQSQWGVVARSLSADPGLSQAELEAEGRRYLELHKDPLISVSMDARDMSDASGQSFDRITLGRVCRVCLPTWGEVIRQRVVAITWPDVYRRPEQITVTLANKTSTAGSLISGLVVDTTVLRKLVTRNMQEQSYLLIEAKKNITLLSEEIDIIGKEVSLKASEEDLEGLQTTVTVEADGLRSAIQQGEKTIAELNATVAGLQHWVTDADGNVAELTNTVRGMTSVVSSVDGRVSTLTNTADGLTHTLTLQGEELVSFRTRIDEISGVVRDTNGRVGSLAVKSDSVTAKVTGVSDRVSQLAVTADGLNYSLAQQGQELTALRALIGEISLTVKETNGALGQFALRSDAITGKLQDTFGKLTALMELTDDRFTTVLGDIETIDGEVKSVKGSALWQRRDHLTGVVGKFTVDDDGYLRIEEGAGLKITRNGVAYGVYDENNLTAGLLVQKINGSTTAKLKAEIIELDGYVQMTDFEALSGSVSNLIAGLTTASWIRTQNLDVSIKANVWSLQADFADIGALNVDGTSMTMRSMNVVRSIGTVSLSKRYLNLRLADGSTVQLDVVTDVSITPNTGTIRYLGYDAV